MNSNKDLFDPKTIAKALNDWKNGKHILGKSPIVSYMEIARKAFTVEPLPDGASPVYYKGIKFCEECESYFEGEHGKEQCNLKKAEIMLDE